MITTKTISRVSILCLAILLIVSSCKKKKQFKEEDGQVSIDNRDAMAENDAATKDINDAVSKQSALRGKGASTSEVTEEICGLTVDTTGLHLGTIKLNYDGSICNNRKRTGSIRLTLLGYASGKRWKDIGCEIKVEYLAYKITHPAGSKSIQLDGVQTLTNETGGTWLDLLLKTQNSLASTVKGNSLKVTFDDGKSASYNIQRRFTYTLPGNVLTCTGEGIGSLNGITGLENYGLTRDGDEFTSQVSTPVVWNITCGWWAPVKGEIKVRVDSRDFELKCLYAVDAGGNPVSVDPNNCPYGWKVEWNHRKKTKNKVIRYQ